jgi:hypothetical protein
MSKQWRLGNKSMENAKIKKLLMQKLLAYTNYHHYIRQNALSNVKIVANPTQSTLQDNIRESIGFDESIKVAVITQSYYRKDGSSKKCLQNMFKMLEAQTYKNFKVFITGDNYQPENEFMEVCNEYKGEIYIHNNNHSCRDLKLGGIRNYWCCGGVHAVYNSYIKAKDEDYNIALMLDDDDYWYDSYINNVVSNFIKYPETGFMITNAEFCGRTLPVTPINSIYYNNYMPRGGDSVRSASSHNISKISECVLKIWKDLIDEVTKMNVEQEKWVLSPCDMHILNIIGKNVLEDKYKSLFIPIALVKKNSDCNWGNINNN